eukprot:759061-Hanusia_phi.AAC.3
MGYNLYKALSIGNFVSAVEQTFSDGLQSNTLIFLHEGFNPIGPTAHFTSLTDAEIVLCTYSVKHIKRSSGKQVGHS